MIEILKITKKFRGKTVLKEVSLNFEKGIYGMLGPNGSGKTTLIRCILGLYPVSLGEIRMNVPYHNIGYLPQNFGLFFELTVYDMLCYFCSLKKIEKNKQNEAIDLALNYVNLYEYKKTKIAKLSGGMQRRVGIAQAILGTPPFIIFDEPTVGLDPEERRRFKDVLYELGKLSTILLSSHIVEDLEDVCGEIIIMNKGEVLKMGNLQEICEVGNLKVDLEKAYLNIINT